MLATPNSRKQCRTGRGRSIWFESLLPLLVVELLLGGLSVGRSNEAAPAPPGAASRASNMLATARERYRANTNDAEAAVQLGRACFDAWPFLQAKPERERLALEGVAVCRDLSQRLTNHAAGHFFLALNLGQLARTRGFSALKILAEMETALKVAIHADPKLDFAGPDRTLGMLYRDAPGWPISLGSHKKARLHLERCLQIAPEYPENHFVLIELWLAIGDQKAALTAIPAAEAALANAERKFPGEQWAMARHDWTQQWQRLRKQLEAIAKKPPPTRRTI